MPAQICGVLYEIVCELGTSAAYVFCSTVCLEPWGKLIHELKYRNVNRRSNNMFKMFK